VFLKEPLNILSRMHYKNILKGIRQPIRNEMIIKSWQELTRADSQ